MSAPRNTLADVDCFDRDTLAALAVDGLNMTRLLTEQRETAWRQRRWMAARIAAVTVWGAVGWTLLALGAVT